MIKWEGYPESDNSWEPPENLNCDELLAEFEKNHHKGEKSRRSTKDKGKDKTKEREKDNDRSEKERKKRDSVTVSEDTDEPVSSNTQFALC